MPTQITKTKILLVEGNDEVNLFQELLADLELDDVQVLEVGGKDQFSRKLLGLIRATSGFRQVVKSIGFIRDADNDPQGAFESLCGVLRLPEIGLPEPPSPFQSTTTSPKVTIMIIPDADTKGMIEDVCLNSVRDDPAMACVEQYFQCLRDKQRVLAENVIPKSRVRAFLASREWLEIAHFEYLQKCVGEYEPAAPVSPATVVPKAHVFLASRYTPDLDLGIAAKKSDVQDRYWQFNHSAFDKIKQFLRML